MFFTMLNEKLQTRVSDVGVREDENARAARNLNSDCLRGCVVAP